LAPPVWAEAIGTVIIGREGWLFPAWETLPLVDLATVDKVAPIVAGVVSQFKAAGIDMAVTLMPIRARVYRPFYPSDAAFTADAQRRYAYARDRLTAHGVLVPDLATLFATLAARPAVAEVATDANFAPVGSDLFFKADTHWTTNAALPAADAVAAQMIARFAPAAGAAPGAQLGDAVRTLQEKNDLADLLPVADQAKYKLETYMLPQVAGLQGDDALIAPDAADTVVIGNSYMQPKYGFSTRLSHALNRPVSLFWKIDRYGPYATLAEYLKGDVFKTQRPKLIVWNIRETQMEHLPSDDDFYAQNAMSAADLTGVIKAALG
jgi:alginate O-acetyltransferase complex protein AlgJ